MLALALLVASIAFADSLNPSTVLPALYYSTTPHAVRKIAGFTLGFSLTNYSQLFRDDFLVRIEWRTLVLAVESTLTTLAFGLPTAYSGHNAYWFWGPPLGPVGETVWVGFDPGPYVERFCADGLKLAGHLHNAQGVDDDEQDAPIRTCHMKPSLTWARVWPQLKQYG